MSFGNIIGGLLQKGLSGQSHDRLRAGVGKTEAGGGADNILTSLLGASGSGAGGSGGGSGGLMDLARNFLSTEQVGGMSGAKIGGLGALAGGLLGGGLGGSTRPAPRPATPTSLPSRTPRSSRPSPIRAPRSWSCRR